MLYVTCLREAAALIGQRNVSLIHTCCTSYNESLPVRTSCNIFKISSIRTSLILSKKIIYIKFSVCYSHFIVANTALILYLLLSLFLIITHLVLQTYSVHMAPNILLRTDVLLRNYSLPHSLISSSTHTVPHLEAPLSQSRILVLKQKHIFQKHADIFRRQNRFQIRDAATSQ